MDVNYMQGLFIEHLLYYQWIQSTVVHCLNIINSLSDKGWQELKRQNERREESGDQAAGASQTPLQYNQNMNINTANAEKLFAVDGPAQEAPPEVKDPIEELNPIQLLKKPDEFKEAFFSMVCESKEAFKAKNYERAALALTKCTDMLDLGRNILKEINRHWKLVVYSNLACCYHYTRKLSKCNKFCERIKQELERIMADSPQKEVFLKMARILIKLKFQNCAILSQLEQHNRAFELCKSTLPMLKQYIQTLLAYVQNNSTLDNLQKRSSETVQFSRQVHKFAETLLTDLLKCLNQPLKSKERTAFYYWEKNPQQNQQQVKKKYIPHSENNNCKRSILGVSKSSHWIDEFNIGTIMHFSEMNINDFDNTVPIEEYLFKDKLYELVIYCSMAHFTMATELRLIESTQQDKTENQDNPISTHSNLMKKYGYEEKSELFKLSEIYHLRSIQIMARNIKTTVPYITHIIRSYEKHYIKHKKVLEPIAAIVEQSALSVNESLIDKQNKEEEEGYYETTYNNYLIKKQEKVLERNQYQNQQVGDLLIESQRNPHQLTNRTPTINKEDNYNQPAQKQQMVKEPELNSWIEPPTQQPVENLKQKSKEQSKLMTVKSDSNLRRVGLESPRQEANNSGEYLKSQKKETSRLKKLSIREKSASKLHSLRGSNPTNNAIKSHKQVKKQTKHRAKEEGEKYNDYKLKPEKMDKKEKERKTIKKQKESDHEKYGQRQIKIKTESCTHIKVVYKKKK